MYELYKLESSLKALLLAFTITCVIGVSTGAAYLFQTTGMTPKGTVTRFNGSPVPEAGDDFDIPAEYPKPANEMLLTTHTHILGFSFIFLPVGLIFFCTTLVSGFWKRVLMIEPFVSVILTFGSLWAVRFFHPGFIYLTILSASFMYLSFYTMTALTVFEILFKREKRNL